MSNTTLRTGDSVRIVKGCTARNITKGTIVRVMAVVPLGAEYSHSVKVTLQITVDRRVNFYARHPNRLNDVVINLNDGNPLHTIKIEQPVRTE